MCIRDRDRASEIVAVRQELAKKYDDAFECLEWLKIPFRHPGYEHGYQSYPCLFRPEEINLSSISRINKLRNSWMDKLQANGISTRPATHAVHLLDYYKNKYKINADDFTQAYAADQCSISLPLFHGMKEDEQDFVIEQVLEFQP